MSIILSEDEDEVGQKEVSNSLNILCCCSKEQLIEGIINSVKFLNVCLQIILKDDAWKSLALPGEFQWPHQLWIKCS